MECGMYGMYDFLRYGAQCTELSVILDYIFALLHSPPIPPLTIQKIKILKK